SQGRAQALNMRDSGITTEIGLPSNSRSRRIAKADGFMVTTVRRLVGRCDILCVLAPDHLHGEIFTADIQDHLRPGQMLVFAHAASLHFGAIKPPDDVDTVLIAPLGPGKRLRELYRKKPGVACFLGIHHDATGKAHKIGLALAGAIGCLKTVAIETTFAEEAVGDLFGEQAVLCGGLARLVKLGFDTLVENGLAPEKAYLECVYQLDLIIDLIKADGIAGMLNKISKTAALGAIKNGPRALDSQVPQKFDRIYQEVESGKFFAELIKDKLNTHVDISRLTDDRFEQAARRVGRLLGDRDE
ncbi:MAG: ketol-acid reductoisomerase, partial [Planctomycetes bacterium]|nr:ketol-acid reductoisomerase [Planctomycetota bacterium]